MHDAHCHIDLYPEFARQLATIAERRIATIAVTNTPSVFEMCERICAGNAYVHPALGLHPELVLERERELPILLRLMQRVRFIGEVGLDFTTQDRTARASQVRVFTAILASARTATGKVLSVHSRRASSQVIDLIGPQFPGSVILHWFSGPAKDLRRAISNGYYFSANHAMTLSATGRATIETVPRDKLLLESDGPFVRIDDTPSGPGDVQRVVRHIAGVWNAPASEVERQLDANFATVLPGSGSFTP